MNEHEHKSALEKISCGEVKMRPRTLFAVQTTLQVLGTSVLLLLLIYLASFAMFQAKISGALHLSNFGMLGLLDLILSLPKLIIILSGLLLVLLIWSYDQFPVGYRRPLLISAFGIICIVTTGTILVHKTNLHNFLLTKNNGQLTYKALGALPLNPLSLQMRNGEVGQITGLGPDELILLSNSGQLYTVSLKDLKFEEDLEGLGKDLWVMVRGPKHNHSISAKRIKIIPAINY